MFGLLVWPCVKCVLVPAVRADSGVRLYSGVPGSLADRLSPAILFSAVGWTAPRTWPAAASCMVDSTVKFFFLGGCGEAADPIYDFLLSGHRCNCSVATIFVTGVVYLGGDWACSD